MAKRVPVVAVMGLTGAGKSHFIAQLTGDDSITGNALESVTQNVHEHNVVVDGTKVVILDTPGMNDTNRSDAIVLKEIAEWVKKCYEDDVLLSAVIYMHDISHERMAGSSVASLRIFQELCGKDFYKNIVFVSNRWDKVSEEVGYDKLKQVKDKYWGSMLANGAVAVEFKDDMTAHRILSRIIRDNVPQHPKLAVEIGRDGKSVADTDAGKIADKELTEMKEKFEKEQAEIKEQMEIALQEKDTKMQQLLKDERARNEKKIEKLEQEAKAFREASAQNNKTGLFSAIGEVFDTVVGGQTTVPGPVGVGLLRAVAGKNRDGLRALFRA